MDSCRPCRETKHEQLLLGDKRLAKRIRTASIEVEFGLVVIHTNPRGNIHTANRMIVEARVLASRSTAATYSATCSLPRGRERHVVLLLCCEPRHDRRMRAVNHLVDQIPTSQRG